MLLNNDPVFVCSKNYGSCETSSFVSNFIAMKSLCENLRGMIYELRMLVILVECPVCAFGHNQSVLWNSSNPHSVLNKKTSSISHHFVLEEVDKNEWRTTYLNAHLNFSGMCTETLPIGDKRTRFTGHFLPCLD